VKEKYWPVLFSRCGGAQSVRNPLLPLLLSPFMTQKSAAKTKAYSKTSRCWPGYEPVPGKSEHEEGSCRKKPASRNGGKKVGRETARQKQISQGGKRGAQAKKAVHPRSPRKGHGHS
jgi:hypothetical protein